MLYYEEQQIQLVLEEQQLCRLLAERKKQLERAQAKVDAAKVRGQTGPKLATSLETRKRGLSARLVATEERVCSLLCYNEQLVAAIDNLRLSRAEHARGMSGCEGREKKMGRDLHALQAYVEGELNTRERLARQRKRVEDEAAADAKAAAAALDGLNGELSELERERRRQEGRREEAMQRERQREYKALRGVRSVYERREVEYGYLRSQLEGWREQLRQVQLVAEVRKPGGVLMNERAWATMSAGLLTSAYATSETRNRSMLMHLERVLKPQASH